MTIEALLEQQNTLASQTNFLLKELLDRLSAPTSKVAASPKAEAEVKKSEPAEASNSKPASTPIVEVKTVKEETATVSPSEEAISYDDVKNAVTALVKAKGRDTGLGVLATFGVESATALQENQWQAVIDACKAAL